jgi:AcrR family transcriptional regulator
VPVGERQRIGDRSLLSIQIVAIMTGLRHHGGQMPTRTYTSPLRERQAQQTRDLILDTLTELLDTRRADEVSARDVARAAGVSERTVYRHFPDREALLVGLSDRLLHLAGRARDGRPIETVDDLARGAVELMAGLDEFHVAARAEALLNADPRRYSPATRENTEQFRKMLASAFPDLDERERVRIAAVIRCLLSAQAWLRMREEFGVPGVESGPTVAWVLDTILNEIRQGRGPGPAVPRQSQ